MSHPEPTAATNPDTAALADGCTAAVASLR
jgi:hypothetical protein